MGYWNYRVVYHPAKKYEISGEEFCEEEHLSLHEVYYNSDGVPNAMTEKPVITGNEGDCSLNSLRDILKKQLKALDEPILDENFNEI